VPEEPQGDAVEALERSRVNGQDLSWALRAVMRAHDDVDRVLARQLGLRALDYAAVDQAMSSPDPLRPADISEHLGISSGSTTELLDRLETAGHIRRSPHPTDRRRVLVHAEPAAVEQILDALHPLFAALDNLTVGFTADEQRTIQRYLREAERLLREFHAGAEKDG
jgi:DNA-binding MarR family transcriptional regulator